MANKTYTLVVEGTAHDGQTWRTESQVTIDMAQHGFDDMLAIGMRLSFDKLTGGKAVYGSPGKGCRGPYEIDKITITRMQAEIIKAEVPDDYTIKWDAPKLKLHPSLTVERVAAAAERQMTTLDNPGFCVACGAEQDGCEPDARGYQCESCGAHAVYGAEELLIRLVP